MVSFFGNAGGFKDVDPIVSKVNVFGSELLAIARVLVLW